MKYYTKLVKCSLNYHDANGSGELDFAQKKENGEFPVPETYGSSLTRVCRVLIPKEQAVKDRQYGFICPWCATALERQGKLDEIKKKSKK